MRCWLLLVGLLAGTAQAQSPHIIGASVGLGVQDLDSTENHSSSGGDNYVGDIYYRYMWNANIGVEAGAFAGSSGIAGAIGGIFSRIADINYRGYRAVFYGQYPLSESNSLYLKAGASRNQLQYTLLEGIGGEPSQEVDSNGTDFYGALGWQLRFQSGIGINVEYQYVPIQTLTVQNFNIGVSYRF
ncbi:porin family protein [Shewanella waksmanii]|uniref:porin family protein n=1 Tax=Shewanella waksmanii TaxID=213783 RepID=UPI0037350CDD